MVSGSSTRRAASCSSTPCSHPQHPSSASLTASIGTGVGRRKERGYRAAGRASEGVEECESLKTQIACQSKQRGLSKRARGQGEGGRPTSSRVEEHG
eukprot:949043-Rhodomonas_salina.2